MGRWYRGSYAVTELGSGCVCCTLSAPMQEALVALLDDERPDTILMETTGLAETAAFPALFAAPELAARIHLGSVVGVVDASLYLRYADPPAGTARQVGPANAVYVGYPPLSWLLTVASVGRARVRRQVTPMMSLLRW